MSVVHTDLHQVGYAGATCHMWAKIPVFSREISRYFSALYLRWYAR